MIDLPWFFNIFFFVLILTKTKKLNWIKTFCPVFQLLSLLHPQQHLSWEVTRLASRWSRLSTWLNCLTYWVTLYTHTSSPFAPFLPFSLLCDEKSPNLKWKVGTTTRRNTKAFGWHFWHIVPGTALPAFSLCVPLGQRSTIPKQQRRLAADGGVSARQTRKRHSRQPCPLL